MDEMRLKKILEQQVIPADENAKKRATNLALAEFDNVRREKEKNPSKNSQGSSFLDRLMDSSNTRRRTSMNKRKLFGGMATAMAVVLVAAVSVQQMQERADSNFGSSFSSISSVGKSRAPAEEYRHAAEPQKLQAAEQAVRERAPSSNYASVAPVLSESKREAAKPSGAADYESEAAADMAVASVAPQAKMMMAQRAAAPPYASSVIAPASDMYDPGYYKDTGRDQFKDFTENPVKVTAEEPVSTFSIDVDTSSYSFARRQLNNGVLPQKDAVRVEEMVNYFDYDYPLPATKEEPFKPTVTVLPSPWKDGNKLVHIGIKGYDIAKDAPQPHSHLVFLLDTSGSMNSPDKLPLVINSLKLLLDKLQPDDTVGIVTYAGSAGTALEPTRVAEKDKILRALDNLSAGGSTAGAEGIRQAYQLAESNFDKNAVNRVILATDGDFNVGITNPEELKDFVERERKTGVYLSVLGFGEGNLNDSLMQELAQNGNGAAAYIDTLNEARKVLADEATSTLFPIAKDVKIQVEFNPATVAEYRLIGYETRALNREDFNNDAVDAGDIGAGHAVTAIYEITPAGSNNRVMDDSRYGASANKVKADADTSDEYGFVKIRYKLPDQDTSRLISAPIAKANEASVCPPCPKDAMCEPCADSTVPEQQFAVAVAAFAQLLKGGKYTGTFSYDDVIALAQENKGKDEFGYRAEFINMVRLAKSAAAMQHP